VGREPTMGSEREVGERDFKKREPYDAKGACLAKPNRNFHPRRARQNKPPVKGGFLIASVGREPTIGFGAGSW